MIGRPFYVVAYNEALRGNAHGLKPDYDTQVEAEARAERETKNCHSFYVCYVRTIGPRDLSEWREGKRVVK